MFLIPWQKQGRHPLEFDERIPSSTEGNPAMRYTYDPACKGEDTITIWSGLLRNIDWACQTTDFKTFTRIESRSFRSTECGSVPKKINGKYMMPAVFRQRAHTFGDIFISESGYDLLGRHRHVMARKQLVGESWVVQGQAL